MVLLLMTILRGVMRNRRARPTPHQQWRPLAVGICHPDAGGDPADSTTVGSSTGSSTEILLASSIDSKKYALAVGPHRPSAHIVVWFSKAIN